jgi:hypothetical protein
VRQNILADVFAKEDQGFAVVPASITRFQALNGNNPFPTSKRTGKSGKQAVFPGGKGLR